jgi:aminoacrylate hydrolase
MSASDAESPETLQSSETFEIDGLSVTRYGELQSEVVLMSAGLGGVGSYWMPQLDALRKDHCVLLYDHRGTGRSDWTLRTSNTVASYSVEEMGNDMAIVLMKLGVERAHVVGHAAGGVAGLELARSHPDRVRSLTVVNGWAVADRHFKRCFDIRLAIYEAGGSAAYLRAQPLFLFPASWISDHLSELDEHATLHAPSFQSESVLRARIDALRSFDFTSRLSDIHCPVLLISTKDDMLVPSYCSEVLLSGLSSATLVEMPWGGHAVNVTAPHEFNRRLLAFFAIQQRATID